MSEVYGKRFRACGHDMVWLMRASSPQMTGKRVEWYGNPTWLLPAIGRDRLGALVGGAVRQLLLFRWLDRLVATGRFDLLYAWDDVVLGLLCLHLARQYSLPFVYQLSFLKPEELRKAAHERLYGSPALNAVKAAVGFTLRARILRGADLILPNSEAMAEYLVRLGVQEQRLLTVPMGADTSRPPEQVDGSAVRRRLGLEGPVLIYAGTMSRFRRLDILFVVLRDVCARRPDVRLLMVGDAPRGEDMEFLRRRAREEGVAERVVFAGRVPREEVPAYIRAADVGLSPFHRDEVLDACSPTKVLEYLAMGVPAVGSDNPDQAKVLSESGGGICVPFDSRAFAAAIETLLGNEGLRREMGTKGRRWVEQHRSYDRLADKVEAALLHLARSGAKPDQGSRN